MRKGGKKCGREVRKGEREGGEEGKEGGREVRKGRRAGGR